MAYVRGHAHLIVLRMHAATIFHRTPCAATMCMYPVNRLKAECYFLRQVSLAELHAFS